MDNMDTNSLPAIPPSRQKNIPLETLIELRNKNLSYEQIGKVVGCSKINAMMRIKNSGIETLDTFKRHEGDILSVKGKMLLSNLTDAKVKKASLSQIGVVYGIVKEKELLVRGQATQIIRYDAQALRERYNELKRMLDETIDVTPEDV